MRLNRTIRSSHWIEPTTLMSGGVALLICWGSTAANLSPEEAVRDFLLNPPVISEAKFVIHREGAAPDWYVCKRQANAAFVRWCVSSNEFNDLELPAQNRVVGFYEDYHWSFHRGSLMEWHDTGRRDESNNVVKSSFDTYSIALHMLVSLGVSWMPLGSLAISNDVFSFSSPEGIVKGNLDFEDGKLFLPKHSIRKALQGRRRSSGGQSTDIRLYFQIFHFSRMLGSCMPSDLGKTAIGSNWRNAQ